MVLKGLWKGFENVKSVFLKGLHIRLFGFLKFLKRLWKGFENVKSVFLKRLYIRLFGFLKFLKSIKFYTTLKGFQRFWKVFEVKFENSQNWQSGLVVSPLFQRHHFTVERRPVALSPKAQSRLRRRLPLLKIYSTNKIFLVFYV